MASFGRRDVDAMSSRTNAVGWMPEAGRLSRFTQAAEAWGRVEVLQPFSY